MELKHLGESRVCKGQLLTLYVDDPDDPKRNSYVILYALKSFSVSEHMATYHALLVHRLNQLKSEKTIHDFADYLKGKRLVSIPDQLMLNVGHPGRPPERIVDEYKYKRNPTAFVLDKIKEGLKNKAMCLFSHSGHHLTLLDADITYDEVRVELLCNGENIGILILGVLADALPAGLNDWDLEAIKEVVEKTVAEIVPNQEVKVSRVFLHSAPYSKLQLSCA